MAAAERVKCSAVGCRTTVPGRDLMCRRHWNRTRPDLREALRRGVAQSKGKKASPLYRFARALALLELALADYHRRPELAARLWPGVTLAAELLRVIGEPGVSLDTPAGRIVQERQRRMPLQLALPGGEG